MLSLPTDLTLLAARRHGLFTRADATAAGLSARQLLTLVRAGGLDHPAANVFGIAGSPDSLKRQVLTACLEVGGVATATTACALRDLSGFALGDPIEVLVLENGGSLFSLAALVPELRERQVSDTIEEAMRRGLAREAWLRWMLDLLRRPGRNGVMVFERALDRACRLPVTESWLETEIPSHPRACRVAVP